MGLVYKFTINMLMVSLFATIGWWCWMDRPQAVPPPPEKTPAIALAEGLALRKTGKAPETDKTATIAIHGYFCIMNAIHNDKVRFTDDEWTDGGESDIYRLISYVDVPKPHGKTERRGYVAKIYLPGLSGTLTKEDWTSSKPDLGVKCVDVSPF